MRIIRVQKCFFVVEIRFCIDAQKGTNRNQVRDMRKKVGTFEVLYS